jgi:hypothetical protein
LGYGFSSQKVRIVAESRTAPAESVVTLPESKREYGPKFILPEIGPDSLPHDGGGRDIIFGDTFVGGRQYSPKAFSIQIYTIFERI